ncbi:NAD(P)H-hydrate epimerase, partial [Planctomycetota bacterium]
FFFKVTCHIMRAYSVAEIREMDRAAIEDYGVPGVVLMENAGRAAAELFAAQLQPGERVLITCGRGNNGGDGFVIARHLQNAGFRVQVMITTDEENIKTSADAWTNYAIIKKMNVPLARYTVEKLESFLAAADVVVDALLGTGTRGEVRQPVAGIIGSLNRSGCRIFAVDIPSGLNADTGEICGIAVQAELTATFAAAKSGFSTRQAKQYTGEVTVIDIGMPKDVYPA